MESGSDDISSVSLYRASFGSSVILLALLYEEKLF